VFFTGQWNSLSVWDFRSAYVIGCLGDDAVFKRGFDQWLAAPLGRWAQKAAAVLRVVSPG